MAEAKVTNTDDVLKKKPIMIFGKDIRQITCFRSSFVYGICGGFLGGLVCFMATSKVKMSTHVGFASLWLTVFGYWFPCRYHYEVTLAQMEIVKNQMKSKKSSESET